jgi:hypothetical protein
MLRVVRLRLSAQTPAVEYGATAQLHAAAGFEDVPFPSQILLVGFARIVMAVELTEVFQLCKTLLVRILKLGLVCLNDAFPPARGALRL